MRRWLIVFIGAGSRTADVTISSVAPCDPPPGLGCTRSGTYPGVPGRTVVLRDEKTGDHLTQGNL